MNGRAARAGIALLASLVILCAGQLQARAAGTSTAPVLYYWASVDNALPVPAPNRTITVFGYFVSNNLPVGGVGMSTIWNDGRPLGRCGSTTDVQGVAQCTLKLPNLRLGTSIQIRVTFTYKNGTFLTNTSALPL